MAVVFGGFDEQLDVVDDAFELGAEVAEATVEVVVGQQAEDGDRESAGGGDKGLGNSAADLGRRELLVADEAERPHDAGDGSKKPEQRGQGDQRAEDPLQAFGASSSSDARICIAPSSEL